MQFLATMRRALASGLLLLGASIADAKAFPMQSYQTESFNIPAFHVTRKNVETAPGYLFLGMVHPASEALKGPFIANDTGELIWHGSSNSQSYYNFQTQDIGGQPILSYWTGVLDATGHGYGQVNILDNTYTQTKTICFPPEVTIVPTSPNEVPPGGCFVDKHESIVVPERNSIIVTAYNATQTDLSSVNGPKDGWVYDCLFFELDLDTNDILFSWSALENVPLTESKFVGPDPNDPLLFGGGKRRGYTQATAWDFFHINSVEAVPGGYLANSRYTWSFYFVEAGTGNVRWTLEGSHGGDFELLDKSIFFSWQHHVRVEELHGSHMKLHLFNNDNVGALAYGKNRSCGWYFNVNTDKFTVSINEQYIDETHKPIYAAAEGSVQTLQNGHHLVGYGKRPFIEEYDGEELIYRAQFAAPTASTHTYRAYRLPWVGNPAANPKIVASQVNGTLQNTIQAYMSWNGGTQYTQWNLYAGETQDNLSVVASNITKDGFETMEQVTDSVLGYQYVQAEALGPDGGSLGMSDVEQVQGSGAGGLNAI